MARPRLAGWSPNRLRILLLVFFLALAIPTGLLFYQAYSQIKWEAFHQHRLMAEELVVRIDERYAQLVEMENLRAFTDYAFLNVASNKINKDSILFLSPLSSFPVEITIPGTIGYFQIDPKGQFSTPLLPPSKSRLDLYRYGLGGYEISRRMRLQKKIHRLLAENQILSRTPAKNSAQRERQLREARSKVNKSGLMSLSKELDSLFDTTDSRYEEPAVAQSRSASEAKPTQELNSRGIGRVKDLMLKNTYQERLQEEEQKKRKEHEQRKRAEKEKKSKYREMREANAERPRSLNKRRALRKEQSQLPSEVYPSTVQKPALQEPVSIFESEVDSFEFAILNSGHFIFYRKVWRDKQRFIQGMLLNSEKFISGIINDSFYGTAVSNSTNLAIASQGDVLSALNSRGSTAKLTSSSELSGTLLLHDRLSAPFDQIELIFSVDKLPAGPGGVVLSWTAGIILLVLVTGFFLMYRLAMKQVMLSRQQQDFVSAVSHELKTPLTSIRMYGEMLREGWADEAKRKTYYDYIYDESERLTRLINNVLQLARMTRNDLQADLTTCSVSQLLDNLCSKVQSQIDHAGFTLNIQCDDAVADKTIEVDADYFSQIIINIVDNAIKFSTKSEKKQIDISCTQLRDGSIQIGLRDFGPGIPKDQLRKIFQLFYRTENELTRETVGTGIGLALVQQLVQTMRGKIDVVNMDPGVEFRISFPTTEPDK